MMTTFSLNLSHCAHGQWGREKLTSPHRDEPVTRALLMDFCPTGKDRPPSWVLSSLACTCSVHSPVSDAEDKKKRKPDSGSQELKVKREILPKFHVLGMVL